MTGEKIVLNLQEFFQTREITERTEYTLDADLKWFTLVLLKSKAQNQTHLFWTLWFLRQLTQVETTRENTENPNTLNSEHSDFEQWIQWSRNKRNHRKKTQSHTVQADFERCTRWFRQTMEVSQVPSGSQATCSTSQISLDMFSHTSPHHFLCPHNLNR